MCSKCPLWLNKQPASAFIYESYFGLRELLLKVFESTAKSLATTATKGMPTYWPSQLRPRSRVLLENLIIAESVNKFPSFYGT
jgi:hypothetical protein